MSSSGSALYTEEAHEIICEACTYGYPLVLMDVMRQVMTAPLKGGAHHHAPLNQFAHARTFSENAPSGHLGPDADTLQSTAWLNLAKEPIVLSLPDTQQRYVAMQLTDGWMRAFAAIGSRATGSRGGHFVIAGPRWSGSAPSGLQVIQSPTAMVWLIGRTQTYGTRDYGSVHALQRRFMLTPLSSWERDDMPPQNVPSASVDLKASPPEQVARMDGSAFFARLNALLSDNPPHPADTAAMKRFATVGVGAARPFELRDDHIAARSVDGSMRTALARIVVEATRTPGHILNGWRLQPNNVGFGHTDYMWRAVVALVRPGAGVAADTVTLHTAVDAAGIRLTGARRYVLRFAGSNTPPVHGSWSITLHNSRHTFVHSPIDRHAIGSADPLTPDADGTVTLRIQHEPPEPDYTSNWLPAPRDQFNLTMQLRWPRPDILSGAWTPPALEPIG